MIEFGGRMFPGDRVEDVTMGEDCLKRVGNDSLGN